MSTGIVAALPAGAGVTAAAAAVLIHAEAGDRARAGERGLIAATALASSGRRTRRN
jgi:NAD(P)H-hydrate repair Nnr-like enzyme with NAD(P)H-hydrate dehydratase domain